MGAFHAYDIRGIYGVDFDKETAYKVGYFLPELLSADKVLVGRDVRLSSDEIHKWLLEGITDAGADVYDAGLATTPMIYFGTAFYGFKASVQITASHNPAEYNGMKISRENALPVGLDTGLGRIREWIDAGRDCPVVARKGQVHQFDVRKDYLPFLLSYKEDWTNLKIAMDVSNGMASLFVRDIFGAQPYYIYEEMDGRFPNHEPNPLVQDNVRDLKKAVIENGADIGVIYDGDADRVMFVDENGRFISPDLMIAVLGHYFLEEKGERGPVLQDIRSSKAVGEYLTPMGAQMHTWRVGRAYAALKLREINGIYGGELAGHYYFRDFFYSDSGLLASILIINVVARMKRKGVSLSGLIAGIESYSNSGEINFRVEDKLGAMNAVRDYFTAEEKPVAYMDFDGYRVEFPDWWFNIRPSNTEPYLRFICEATSPKLLDSKIAKVKEILKKLSSVALLLLFSINTLVAGDLYKTRIDTTRTQLSIPRPALQPLKSLIVSDSEPMDTLNTVNEFIKVVIYSDNTWQYIKLPGYVQNTEVFKKHWNTEVTDPYKLEMDDLEDSWSIWLVDSLDQYRCPYQGDVYPRGKFGIRRGRRHQGVDIPLKEGEPVYATFTGQVRMSKYFGGFGNLIVIRHENGMETFYGHLSKRKVAVGDWVNAGDVIGYGGSTGRSTGPHLHFETRYQGFAFDPQWLIDFKSGTLRQRLFVLKKRYFSPYSNYEQDFEDEFKNAEEDKAEADAKAAIRYHIVRQGDTLYSLARANGITVDALCKMNGISAKSTLRVGQKLRVH